MKRVQNWLPYNESLLFDYSDAYFRESGKTVFSCAGKTSKDIVPNAMTNSKAHARSFANFVKDSLENHPQGEKFRVLEIGSGAGVFARNFLICAREMNFLDRIEYLVTEYSRVGLEQIKDSGILKDFEENSNYRFVHLDILNPQNTQDLSGKPFKLENLSATVLNYILCVLPLTVLRMSKGDKLQQMHLRFKQAEDCKDDSAYLKHLSYDEDWKGYLINNESDPEKKYYNILLQSLNNNSKKNYNYYSYGGLQALDNILNCSNDNAFIFIAEMPDIKNSLNPYQVYGNSIAHPFNCSLYKSFVESQNIKSVFSIDNYYPLVRMYILKNPLQEDRFINRFNKEYLEKNDSNLIIDLRYTIGQFNSKHSITLMKNLLNRLIEIDSDSYETKLLQARYYFMQEDLDQARLVFKDAERLDYLNNLDFEASGLKKYWSNLMNKLEDYRFNFFINCFPFGNSIAKVLSSFAKNSNIAKLEILELYSYPGIFTRNMFISLRDLGLSSGAHYVIHEENNLEELQSKCSVESLGVNYEFSSINSLKAIEDSSARILILNNTARTQPEQDLELIIKTASKNKNIELILGAEINDLELRGIKDIENYYLWQFQSNYLTHYAYIKTELNQKLIIESLEQEFKINNNYEKFFDLTRVLNTSKSRQFCEFSQSIILDEYIKLDGYSANCHILIAKYLSLIGNNEGYQEHLKKARLLDTHKLLKIH